MVPRKNEVTLKFWDCYSKAMDSRDSELVRKLEELEENCYKAKEEADKTIDPILQKELDEAKTNLRRIRVPQE